MSRRRGELTPQQRALVEAYTDLGGPTFNNGTESARTAGYKGNAASLRATSARTLALPHVKAAVKARMIEHGRRNEVTIDSVIQDLVEDRRMAIESGNVMAAIKVTELRGKLVGAWIDKVRHTTLDDRGEETGLRVITLPVAEFHTPQRAQLNGAPKTNGAELPAVAKS